MPGHDAYARLPEVLTSTLTSTSTALDVEDIGVPADAPRRSSPSPWPATCWAAPGSSAPPRPRGSTRPSEWWVRR